MRAAPARACAAARLRQLTRVRTRRRAECRQLKRANAAAASGGAEAATALAARLQEDLKVPARARLFRMGGMRERVNVSPTPGAWVNCCCNSTVGTYFTSAQYIAWFPRVKKYISLYPRAGGDDEKTINKCALASARGCRRADTAR